jgi:hypothetical protein
MAIDIEKTIPHSKDEALHGIAQAVRYLDQMRSLIVAVQDGAPGTAHQAVRAGAIAAAKLAEAQHAAADLIDLTRPPSD